MAPFAAQAETWNIYGWQNHSWEFVDHNGRDTDRMNSNAGNIGFAASVDTGMDGIHVNVQCEQFTFYNQFADSTASTWCNRNSKIGLSHPQMGEIMLATWLLPYNEGVAQWVDPFYDAGADSHTNIMGSMGASSSTFYNPVFGRTSGFNRRQENIIQYWSPNWNGFVFRFAWTMGNNDETPAKVGTIDPVIRSSSLAYTNGPLWLAVTWQDHEDWAAFKHGEMNSSDAESFRVAGRYIMDMGDGVSVQISAMWEDVEHEFNGVTSVDAAMRAFGYSGFADSYTLQNAGTALAFNKPEDLVDISMPPAYSDDPYKRDAKTYILWNNVFGADAAAAGYPPENLHLLRTFADDETSTEAYVTSDGSSLTECDGTQTSGTCRVGPNYVRPAATTNLVRPIYDVDHDGNPTGPWQYVEAFGKYVEEVRKANMMLLGDDNDSTNPTAANLAMVANYDALAGKAKERGMAKHHAETAVDQAAYDAALAEATDGFMKIRPDAAGNVKIERDAWLISGKIKFGGPVDFRFSYAEADDMEVSCNACSGDWDESGGDAWNVGMFYTMPAGTELRLTYSEVNSDDNVGYGQSIPGTGVGDLGNEIEMFAVGIVHWFD